MVYVSFERGRDNLLGPSYGPFEYVQFTYREIRTPGDKILAVMSEEDDWVLTGDFPLEENAPRIFSDVIIRSAED